MTNRWEKEKKDAGEEHGASKQDAGIQEKYKVGLGLCLAEFPKHGNLHYDVLTETDGAHVVMPRGVASEHMLGRKVARAPV